MLRRPFDVVADEQVEKAVAIEIQPHGRGAEAGLPAKAGLVRNVDEVSFAGVLKELVLADRSDQDVRETVVVVIADGDAETVKLDREAGLLGDVGESAVAIVAIESRHGAAGLVARPVGPVDQEDVEPAVAIV